ncbi:MAG: acyltransferase [Rubrobacter sp.]|nr:acyltransferase [Rubrobacter sp.]
MGASVAGNDVPEAGGTRLRYLSGLDGLRALAVAAVLVYHANAGWLPGGFLGVEVFFVISGYLITALLLTEWRERGGIDILGFWMRRARRLLPAVFLVIIASLVFAVLFLPEEVAGLRWDALAAFGYATNWYLVAGQESYFEAVGRPSLLTHLWSLAVEEQFYLVWPVISAVALAVFGRRGLLFAAVAGAVGSTVLMANLYTPDVDPSRLYYGTDTRAAGLLIGAALACLWVPGKEENRATEAVQRRLSRRDRRTGRLRRKWGWAAPLMLDVAGLVALGGLVYLCFTLNEYGSFLYRGGFAVVGLVTAVLITALVHPRTHTGLMDLSVLRWIGVRSYGIYLWHWPIYTVTRPQLDVPFDGPQLLALRLAATLVLADLSYRLVETPIRRGSLGRKWRAWRNAPRHRRRRLNAGWATAAIAIVAISSSLGTAVVRAEQPENPVYLAKKAIHTNLSDKNSTETTEPKIPVPTDKPPKDVTDPDTKDKPKKKASGDNNTVDKPEKEKEPASGVEVSNEPVGRVTAVGDSVMLGAADSLEREVESLEIMDAAVGLYPGDAIEILRSRSAAGELGDTVIIHVGENGPFSAAEFEEMMEILDGRRAVFVNVKVPRTWEQPNNEVLAEGTREYPNAVLVDWYAASAARPELFWDDGIHLRPEGAEVYAGLISEHLKPKA